MYLWKIEKLKQVLEKRSLSQEESFKYIIYLIVVLRIGVLWSGYPTIFKTSYNWPWLLTSFILMILEVFACYKFNRGKNGNDFLGRYFSIRLLTTIRWFAFALLTTCLLAIPFCWEFEGIVDQCLVAKPLYGKAFKYSIGLFWTVLIPLRTILHMRSLNRSEVK